MAEKDYNFFSQYFAEISNILEALEDEAEELHLLGKEVPQNLAIEIYKTQVLKDILTQAGEELYNKSPDQIFHDGFDAWLQEDSEFQGERYGI